MSADVAAGTGDLVEELLAEIAYALGCEKAKLSYTPSSDILELLTASKDEIQRLRGRVDELESVMFGAERIRQRTKPDHWGQL